MIKKIRTKLQNLFIAGLLVLLPISITVFILTFVFQKLDNLLSPAFVKLLILIIAFFFPIEGSSQWSFMVYQSKDL